MNLSSVQTAARAHLERLPATAFACPVLALLVEHEELVKAFNHEDRDQRRKGEPVDDNLLRDLSVRMTAIPEEVSHLFPLSYEGAVFQIMLAASEPEGLSCWDDDGEHRFMRLIAQSMERLNPEGRNSFPATRKYLLGGLR